MQPQQSSELFQRLASGRAMAIRTSLIAPFEYELVDETGPRRAHVFADPELLAELAQGRGLQQLLDVARLPGLFGSAFGMPDMRESCGSPAGGVAATLLPHGAISPGSVDFDINCGVRLLASELDRAAFDSGSERVMGDLRLGVSSGCRRGDPGLVDRAALARLLERGCPELLERFGCGAPEDLEAIEAGGAVEGADARAVGEDAMAQGLEQLGTLGGGNHSLEIEVVESVFDADAAARLGLRTETITVLIHSGSLALGSRVCSDALRQMDEVKARFGVVLPDRHLACAPLSSPEGRRYLGAMRAAANFAFANRGILGQRVRRVFARRFGDDCELQLVHDAGHNTETVELHEGKRMCVHRKGATRALGPSSPELPGRYRGLGQPVLLPGRMGSASYVLLATDEAERRSLASACHGGCENIEHVVAVVVRAGLARKVARLMPIGVVRS